MLFVYDALSTLDLTYLVSAQLGGAPCARGVGSNARSIGACRLPGLLFGPTRCWRSSAALPALGLWDLTPGPSAHVGCSGSSLGSDPLGVSATRRRYLCSALILGLRLLRSRSAQITLSLAPAAHSLPPPKALPELRDSATPSAYAYRHRCSDVAASSSLAHRSAAVCSTAGMFRMLWRLPDPSVWLIHHPLLISPPFQARSLLPESPVSFRSTADSPMSSIYEISNEIIAPMTMFQPHFKSGVRLWLAGAPLSRSTLIDFTSEVRIGRESTLQQGSSLRRSNLRPPLASLGFNSVTDDVVNPDSSSKPRRAAHPYPRSVGTRKYALCASPVPNRTDRAARRHPELARRAPSSRSEARRRCVHATASVADARDPRPLLVNLVRRSESAHRAPLTASHRIAATKRRIVRARLGPPPSASSLVPRLERRFELGVGCEGGVRGRARASSVPPTPPPAPLPSVRLSLVPRLERRFELGVGCEGGVRAMLGIRLPPPPSLRPPRPSSLVSSADSSLESASEAACEHERTNGGPRSLPPPPSLRPLVPRPSSLVPHPASSRLATPPSGLGTRDSGRGPPLIRVEVEPRCRASQQKPEIGTRPDPRRLACEHRTRSVPPAPLPSHRSAADIGPPSSLVSSADSSSESAAKASTERAASRPRPCPSYVAPLRRPCPPYVAPC
ncbi:hypothetical protein B0H15DRAFT_955821 [Mycena belliarum]|uniref:Uncharacterized protein n=1 Tax=Mycena belliarum TaxID=1033014 RepID=A0AAD6TTH9_9AGAR|nr:hypothetical protein B0H15DRAFT_955821 [Mycena belliae]